MSVSDVRGCPAGWRSQLILSKFCKQISLKLKLHLTIMDLWILSQKLSQSGTKQWCSFYFTFLRPVNAILFIRWREKVLDQNVSLSNSTILHLFSFTISFKSAGRYHCLQCKIQLPLNNTTKNRNIKFHHLWR